MDALTPYNPPRFIAGLDIGQMADPSALTVVERDMHLWQGRLEPQFFCGHLERLPLQTPYPTAVELIRQRLERLGERCALVIDATGVGRGVVDLFREAWTVYDAHTMQRVVLAGKPSIIAVTLTHGERAKFHAERWDEITVPTLEVIMRLVVVLQKRHLTAAETLDEFPTLVKEAQAFQWRVSTAKDEDPYLSWKSGKHDDLLLALAIAVWWGALYAPTTVPSQQTQYATGTRNPLLRHPHRSLADAGGFRRRG